MVDKWIFRALDKSLDRQSFDCGVVELNDYSGLLVYEVQ
jgi:hypothetical protein